MVCVVGMDGNCAVCVFVCVCTVVCAYLGSRGQLLLCFPPGQAQTQKGACIVKDVGDTWTHRGALGTTAMRAFSFAGLLASETQAALF